MVVGLWVGLQEKCLWTPLPLAPGVVPVVIRETYLGIPSPQEYPSVVDLHHQSLRCM
jgi:hypothetical protein